MSEFEMLNQKIVTQKAVRRKDALGRLVVLYAIVLAAVLLFYGLEYIGFISDLFMCILIAIAVCTGAFYTGRISIDFKR